MPPAVSLTAVGPHALLAEVQDSAQALSLAMWARAARVPADEIVPGARSVLFDGVDTADALESLLARWSPGDQPPTGPLVEVPVTYDGDDLGYVAKRWDTDVDGVVARHTQVEFIATFCGFAPGFAYLAGLPEDLAVPRLDSPRSAVPRGAVALADTWCGVYPTASPGGWRLLGTTTMTLWDAARDEPALLAPGTRVSFRVA